MLGKNKQKVCNTFFLKFQSTGAFDYHPIFTLLAFSSLLSLAASTSASVAVGHTGSTTGVLYSSEFIFKNQKDFLVRHFPRKLVLLFVFLNKRPNYLMYLGAYVHGLKLLPAVVQLLRHMAPLHTSSSELNSLLSSILSIFYFSSISWYFCWVKYRWDACVLVPPIVSKVDVWCLLTRLHIELIWTLRLQNGKTRERRSYF